MATKLDAPAPLTCGGYELLEVIGRGGMGVVYRARKPGLAREVALVLQQDEDQYRAYWTVRRHVGKGVPPREMGSAAELIGFVQATAGAVALLHALRDDDRVAATVVLAGAPESLLDALAADRAPEAVVVFHDGDLVTVLPPLSAPPTAPGAARAWPLRPA